MAITRTAQRVMLVQTLDSLPGKWVSDAKGQATARLREIYPSDTGPNFSTFLAYAERDGLITRRLNGKRCYDIRLNHNGDNFPDNFRDLITAEIVVEETLPDVAPEPEPETPSEPLTLDPALIDYDLLGASVLKAAAEALTNDTWSWEQRVKQLEETLDKARTRLADTLSDNNRIRVKLETVEDNYKAQKSEIGGLRARISDLEIRLSRAQRDKDEAVRAAQRDAREKGLDRLIRERPHEPGKSTART